MKIYRPVMFEFCEKCKKLRRIRIKCKLNNVLVKHSGFLPSYKSERENLGFGTRG